MSTGQQVKPSMGKKSELVRKEVIIKVRDNVFRLAKEAPDVYGDSDVSFGSFFDGSSPVRPLDFYEEREIMPKVIGVSNTSPDFEDKVLDYMLSLTVKVNPKLGKTLNITIRGYKDVVVDEEETIKVPIPEAPADFIMWRLALKHPRVAGSRLEVEDMPNGVIFYIENKQDELERKSMMFANESEAQKLWLRLTSDEEKIKANAEKISHIFELTKDIHNESSKGKELMEKVITLNEKVVKADPLTFTQIALDETMGEKVLVLNCLEYGVLSKVGNTFYDHDQPLGEDLNEVVLYMKNPKHADFIGKLSARLMQAKNTTRK